MLYSFLKRLFQAQVAPVVRSLPANVEDIRDVGLIPGSRRSLEKEMVTHSSILAWRIPQTEEPGGVQSIRLTQHWTGLKRFSMQHLSTY